MTVCLFVFILDLFRDGKSSFRLDNTNVEESNDRREASMPLYMIYLMDTIPIDKPLLLILKSQVQ